MTALLQQLITAMAALIALLSPPVLGAIRIAEITPLKNDLVIETTLEREKSLNLAATSLQVSVGTGYTLENQLITRNNLRETFYTDNEYRQIKEELTAKELRPDEEWAMWTELLDKQCAGKTLTVNGVITQEMMNKWILNGCR